MKVCVLMFYDEAIKEYGSINYEINKKYCDKYGLDIILSTTKKTQRHSAWERLPLILEHLPNYDYVIWIDADAFFYNDGTNIVEEIIYKNLDVNFIFSNDIGNRNINTGIFIVKNSEYSINFITKWAYDEELYINNIYPKWWDQGVLITMIDKNILDIKNNHIFYDYNILQHFYQNILFNKKTTQKPFVLHLAGQFKSLRISVSKEYYELINK